MNIFKISLVTLIISVFFSSCYNSRIYEIKEWEAIFEKHGLEGAFELNDNNKETSNYHNLELCSKPVAPAGTFYILMSLIAIETSAVMDENKPPRWIKELPSPDYSDSINLRDAFNTGNNAFFVQLHNRISKDYYTQYYDSIQYGNKFYGQGDIWTNGPVLISPDEQVGLMKRIYHNKIKFVSERTTTIMKSMMLKVDKPDVKFYSYSAPVKIEGQDYYWIVGMVENFNPLKNPKTDRIDNIVHPYFYSLLVKSKTGTVTEEKATALLHDLLTQFQVKYQ